MISVLLPTYNAAATLRSAINSILRQTFREFELLVLDDGSTDNSDEIVFSFRDSRIRYIKLEHQGLAQTLNHGLRVATYDIIARMDADDVCVPQRFEKQFSLLTRLPENTLLSSWYAVFIGASLQYIVKTPTTSSEIKKGLLLYSYLSHPGLMLRKHLILEYGGYRQDVNAFEDYATWLQIKEKVEFAIIPEVLVFQRYRANSLSNNMVYKQQTMYAIQEPYYRDLKHFFGISNKAEEALYRGWREYFYGQKSVARTYWNTLGFSILQHPRAVMAWLMTLFPEKYFVWFKELRVRFRLEYLLKYFFPSSRNVRQTLQLLVRDETA